MPRYNSSKYIIRDILREIRNHPGCRPSTVHARMAKKGYDTNLIKETLFRLYKQGYILINNNFKLFLSN